MLGPGDVSVLAGVPYQFDHPIIAQALARIARAAKRAGIHWGTVSPGPDHARKLMAAGARFICHNADICIIKRGLEEIQTQFESLGFTFDNRLAAMAAELEGGNSAGRDGRLPATRVQLRRNGGLRVRRARTNP
jgi:hypothetical protein